MDGTSGVYWSIKPNILKDPRVVPPQANEFLQILYWKSDEFPLEIRAKFTGKLGRGLLFVKKAPSTQKDRWGRWMCYLFTNLLWVE